MASRAVNGRAVAIIVGLVLALVAAFLIWRYVGAADQRAQVDAELVDVYVATGSIPEGLTAQNANQQGLIEIDEVPTANRPDTAVTNLGDIAGLVSGGTIPAGAFIQTDQWVESTLAGADLDVDEGLVGVSLQVGIPEGLSGYLAPGDDVAIISHIDAQLQTTEVTEGPDGGVITASEVPEVTVTKSQFVGAGEVLTIGRRVISQDAEGNQDDSVQQTEQVLATVAVEPAVAERLVFAYNEGLLHFTLLPEGGQLADTNGATFDTLFPQ